MAEKPSEQSIFLHAVGLASPADRAAYLEDVCRDNPRLQQELDALLAAHDRLGVEQPPSGPGRLLRTIDEPNTERAGTMIGPYKLMEQIGEGGFGLVFVAEQLEPVRRKVALKVIKPGMDSAQIIARFEAERQALALMDHPNIAKVLDAGATASGRPYFVMELVRGVPITDYCDRNQLTPRERLELFVMVCRAIQHAHQKGVIHRDVKPSNVLVTSHDGKPVVKVIDFGVAKAVHQHLTERTIYTQFAQMIGTPLYMSPEQAEMSGLDIDTRTDIYSLGVLLYELLTGSTPLEKKRFATAAYDEIRRLIREEEPPRPSKRLSTSDALPSVAASRRMEPARLSRMMRGELDWIVMKALEKDRTRRYETASGLAQDIERYLADEPVEACPPSASYKLRKFARRYRTPLRVASAFLILLILGVIASIWQAIRATVAERAARASEQAARASEEVAQEQKEEADAAKEQAEKQRNELAAFNDALRRANYIADMNLAHHAWADNNLIRTRELLELHRPKPGEPDLRGFEWHYLRRLFGGELKVVQAHAGSISTISFSPDGKRLYSCGRSRTPQSIIVEKDPPHEIKLWDVVTGRQLPLGLKEPTAKARSLAVSPDGKRLAAACGDQGIWVWDIATGEPTILERHRRELDVSIGFSPDGKRLFSLSAPEGFGFPFGNYTVRIWDPAVPGIIATIPKHSSPWSGPRFSPDGKLLAIPEYRQSVVRVFDAATGREVFSCTYRDGYVSHAVFSPDGKRLAACGERGIQLWDTATHEPVATWPIASNFGYFLAYSPDGNRLAVGTIEGAVELWDTGTGRKVHTYNGHTGSLKMMDFSPDGTRLASAGTDGTVRLWDPTLGGEIVPLVQSGADVGYPELSPNGQTVLEGVSTAKVRFRNAATGQRRGAAILSERSIFDSLKKDWTADGKRLFTLDGLNEVKVFDVATGKVDRTFAVTGEKPGALGVSPDGKWFAHAAPRGTIKVRDAVTGTESRTIQGLTNPIHCLVFSPGGARLLGVDTSGEMKVWDRATGRETMVTRLSRIFVLNIRFSADGKRLAVVGNHNQSLVGEVRILDADSGRELLALKGHSENVLDADFSPDGHRLATCSADRTIRLWDLAAGQEILTLRGHTLAVDSVRFVTDGRRLISVSMDRTVRVWDATPLPE
jgi:WD40 repeat protein/serine/threonine protein kinase